MMDKDLTRDMELDGHDRLVKGAYGVVFFENLLLCVLG
jgi:hypothetical protein